MADARPIESHIRLLMCPPDYFGVEYVINPWMQGNLGQVTGAARTQWEGLYQLLTGTLGVLVELVPPVPGLPDMVFTANAGLVRGDSVVPSRFRYPERQGEETHFRAWFADHGYRMGDLPEGIAFEGEGDALFQSASNDSPLLWTAEGFRSDPAAREHLARFLGVEIVPLRLTNPRFYHLDTCFAPLPEGGLLWYPPGFDPESQARIEVLVPEEHRLAVDDADAAGFACNAVPVGKSAIVLNSASPTLRRWLEGRGLEVYVTPLTEFMKAGGSAKCLCLRLPRLPLS